MRKYIYHITVIFFVLLTATSCNDWLTLEPEGELLKDNFWQTKEDVEAATAAMYNALQGSTERNLIWGEVRADIHEFSSVDFANYVRIAESNITPSNGAVDWAHYYNTINLANTLLYYNKQVYGNDVTFTKELLDQNDAEAKFVRCLNFFYLVRLWNEVPLTINATISDTVDVFIPKSTEQQVINFITKDLLEAKDLASTELSDDITIQKGRANKYSIMALLADVYLWNEQYQLANNYCDSIIYSGHYGLQSSESWWNLYYPGNSRAESIFEIQYNTTMYDEANPIYNDLLPLYGFHQMIPDNDVLKPLLSLDDQRICNPNNLNYPYPGFKYTLMEYGGFTRPTTEEDANFIYYRFADIILIKAEALNELGDETTANELISLTKSRAGTSHTTISGKEALRTEILNERAREFLAEGKRWFDVLRFAKKDGFANKDLVADMLLAGVDVQRKEILSAYVYDTLSYYLPIQIREIETNYNLVQNPFYDKY